jgi:hypothetical protein
VHMVAWGVVFVSKFDYFLQQKLVIIVLKFQLHDCGERFVEGWG